MTGDWDDRPVKDGGCLLGSGGFGVVFRGSMGGTDVAVKKLNAVSQQRSEIMFYLLWLTEKVDRFHVSATCILLLNERRQ